MNSIVNYFKEARLELKKVIWPTRQETTRATVMVIAISVFVAVFLGGLDIVFTFVMRTFVLRI